MDTLSLHDISRMSNANIESTNTDITISSVSIDSRTLEVNSLFVALQGNKYHGNHFIHEAIARGAVAILSDKSIDQEISSNIGILMVDNTLIALTNMAKEWRKSLKLNVIAITGSNGKTSTKNFIHTIVSENFKTTSTRGNENNGIGLPLSILRTNSDDQVAIWELGMNHAGEIHDLGKLALPNIAVITNIGRAHIGNFHSISDIAYEKGSLLEYLSVSGYAVLPAEDAFNTQLCSRTKAQIIEVGFSSGDIRATNIESQITHSTFKLDGIYGKCDIFLPIPGKHMIHNTLLSLAVAYILNIDLEVAVQKLSKIITVPGRSSWIKKRDIMILDDTYNANLDSVIAALALFKHSHCSGKKIAVLGYLAELGDHANSCYDKIGKMAASTLHTLITVGDQTVLLMEIANRYGLKNNLHCDNHELATELLYSIAKSGDIVLVKGSRTSKMESIIQLFE